MNDDDFARRGADLLERVRQQVDAPRRLRQLEHRERNTRMVAIAVAAVAVAFFALLGGLWWLSADIPPVDQPEPTTTLRSLPVETSVVLLDQFTIDEATGSCAGDGPFAGISAGAVVRVVEDFSRQTVVETELDGGIVIDRAEVERLGGTLVGPDACRLIFETGLGEDDFNDRDIDVGLEEVGSVKVDRGLRLTLFYGGNQ